MREALADSRFIVRKRFNARECFRMLLYFMFLSGSVTYILCPRFSTTLLFHDVKSPAIICLRASPARRR